MSAAVSSSIYSTYGRFYDVGQFLFNKRLGRAIRGIDFRAGDQVLDVGIGTGLSLAHYPDNVQVTGIDLCPAMLEQAQRKLDSGTVRADGAPTHLLQGDAMNLPFDDGAFDVVFLSHVISTVPDPQRCLAEALRVARRDRSQVVLVNHFRSRVALLGWVESALDPLCRRLGWRSDLGLEELLTPYGLTPPRKGGLFETVELRILQGRVELAGADPEWAAAVATAQ